MWGDRSLANGALEDIKKKKELDVGRRGKRKMLEMRRLEDLIQRG